MGSACSSFVGRGARSNIESSAATGPPPPRERKAQRQDSVARADGSRAPLDLQGLCVQ